MSLGSHVSHLEHLLHPHEHEHHAPEHNQGVLEVMRAKLTAFNVPRALWLFVFHEQARRVYEDLMWDFVGDPKRDDIAAHPEITTGEFFHRKHTFVTHLGHIGVVRERLSEDEPSPSDFMVMIGDLESGTQQRLYVTGQERERVHHGYWGNYRQIDTYILSDDPAAPHVVVSEQDINEVPHLVFISPAPRIEAPGAIQLGPDHRDELLWSIDFLATRSEQFFNYFSPDDIARLENLHTLMPTVPNEFETATMSS